jgi:hypothetical protein
VSQGNFDLWLDGQAGQHYLIQSTTNLTNWFQVASNTPPSNSWHVVVPATNGLRAFYRGRWVP